MLGSSKAGSSTQSHPSHKKENESNADIKKILHRVLDLDGPVTLDGLECAHDTITWHLESSTHEICLIVQERELGKRELAKLTEEMQHMELMQSQKQIIGFPFLLFLVV